MNLKLLHKYFPSLCRHDSEIYIIIGGGSKIITADYNINQIHYNTYIIRFKTTFLLCTLIHVSENECLHRQTSHFSNYLQISINSGWYCITRTKSVDILGHV